VSQDNAVSLLQFAEPAATLSEDAFTLKYGALHLLRVAADGLLTPTPDLGDRDVYRGTYKMPTLRSIFGGQLGSPEGIFIYSGGEPGGNEISVGRASNNEICIDDVSVSARHASIEIDERGRIYVTDKASKNGTTVAGVTVTSATEVPFGKSLTFGSVSVLMLPTSQFMELVMMLVGSMEQP